MVQSQKNNNFDSQKLDLIRLRIKNGYYDRDVVLNKVVDELLNNPLASLKKK